jgi:glycosyltransferase involved in cell wall biosynthesis
MPDVVFALVANPYRNSRAVRQIRLLADEGFSVLVLAVDDQSSGISFPPSVEVRCVSVDAAGGPSRFRQINRRFTAAASGINARHFHASDLYVLQAMATAAKSAPEGPATYSYDARECYPHVASTVGRPWVSWYWRHVERRLVQDAAFVFTVSESISEHMANAYGIPRPAVVMNVPESRSFEPSRYLREHTGLTNETSTPIILHLGQQRPDRGCEILVESMRFVSTAHLIFLGSGPLQPALGEQATKIGLSDRIHFLPPVTPDHVLSVTSGATVGVTLLQGTCLNHEYALPNKLFEYVTAGVPVLASRLTELERIVSTTNIGLTVDETNAQSVGTALQQMVSDTIALDRWRRGTQSARETFNWDSASQPFRNAFLPIAERLRE